MSRLSRFFARPCPRFQPPQRSRTRSWRIPAAQPVLLVALAGLSGLALPLAAASPAASATPRQVLERIQWYGQSSLVIRTGGLTIAIDPVQLPAGIKADLILVTHNHQDHYSLPDIRQLAGSGTTVASPFAIPAEGFTAVRLAPGQTMDFRGLHIQAVPAYNLRKTRFHSKSSGFVGYVLDIEGVRVYHAGDTELIPEMQDLACDIAFLPLGQTYTMDSVDQAVAAARAVKARLAVPFHYGRYEGTDEDAAAFVAACRQQGLDSGLLPLAE